MNLIVSGGVERILCINSIDNFQDSVPIKLPLNPFYQNVILNTEKRLLLMWQNQQIKIWKLKEDQSKRLVCKMTLSDPESVTSVAISKNGRYLAVARLSTIKLFELIEIEHGNKLQVVKVPSELLENMGAKLIQFADGQGLIVMVNVDNEVVSVKFNMNDDEDDESELSQFDDEQEPIEYETTGSSNYTHLKINDSGNLGVLSSIKGAIDLIDLQSNTAKRLIKLNDVPTAINFNNNSDNDSPDTVLVTTLDHKLLELTTDPTNSEQTLTPWSKKLAECLPQQFITLTGQPYGIFELSGKVWVWGSNWIAFFDTSCTPTAASTADGAAAGVGSTTPIKKRTRSGAAVAAATASPTKGKNHADSTTGGKGFWFSSNYKSMLLFDKLSASELVVVERPVEDMPSTPAFKLNKIII
ncbi:unnamed protein product [Ambrosiozyma monospora]|uniref:Unnamed protein product n=1 Tax=Ambrosiozyma monospora TaxID=43982 RepID=A0A9W6Z606_AMBMO|nr:unnamed protein product [Ambrosiozyma monospora]